MIKTTILLLVLGIGFPFVFAQSGDLDDTVIIPTIEPDGQPFDRVPIEINDPMEGDPDKTQTLPGTPNPDNPGGPIAATTEPTESDSGGPEKKATEGDPGDTLEGETLETTLTPEDEVPGNEPPGLPVPVDEERRPPKEPINDPEPPSKSGGREPIVFGDWLYNENKSEACYDQHTFDFDNDGFLENFCYEIVGSIFVIDFNGNGIIDNGMEMLNLDRTNMSNLNAAAYLETYPDICNNYDCYLWTDANADWITDEGELESFSFDIEYVRYFPDGKQLIDNQRYIYCSGESTDGEKFYCLQPTYWMRGI